MRSIGTGGDSSFGPGRPLSPIDRAYFEPRLGIPLDRVRVHDSRPARLAARAINAQAFALDSNIVLGSVPERTLLAHELAHIAEGEKGVIRRRDLRQAAFTSSLLQSDLDPLSDTELAELHRFLEQNADHAALDDPGFKANFGVVRSAMISRSANKGQPAKPEPKKKAPLPGFGGQGDAASLTATMNAVASIRQVGSDAHEISWEGATHVVHDADVARIRKAAADALREGLRRTDSIASGAKGLYDAQSETNRKSWFIAPIIQTLGSIEDPGPVMLGLVHSSIGLADQARKSIEAGDFTTAARLLAQAEIQARQADKMSRAFWEKTISTGEFTVSALEVVRDVSMTAVAVIAIVISGGAVLGVGGFTASMASSAGLIATVAPVAASVAEGVAKAAMGDRVDWGSIAIDAAIAAIMYRFGGPLAGKVGNGLTGALIRQTGRSVAKQAIMNAVAGVIVGRGASIVREAIKTVYYNATGRPRTWAEFVDRVAAMLLDPKAGFFDLVAVALGLGHAAKLSAAGSPAPAPANAPSRESALPAKPAQTPKTTEAAQPDARTADQQGSRPPGPAARRTELGKSPIRAAQSSATSEPPSAPAPAPNSSQRVPALPKPDVAKVDAASKAPAPSAQVPVTKVEEPTAAASADLSRTRKAGDPASTPRNAARAPANVEDPAPSSPQNAPAAGAAKRAEEPSLPSAKPKRTAIDPAEAEIDRAFADLESGKLAGEHGAMLGDLMFHSQRRQAMQQLREQVDPNLRTRPGKTPEGDDVNPNPGYQSAHMSPQAPMRGTPEYNPGDMITRFLPTGKGHAHTVFDQHWQAQCRQILKSGRTEMTAQELYEIVSRSATESGAFSPAEGRSVSALVANDLFVQLGLSPTAKLRVPGS